jgi:flavorubredoxin
MRLDESLAVGGAQCRSRAWLHRLHGLDHRSRRPPPRSLKNGTVLDLGGKRLRFIETPHVPHGWEACLFHEETTGTLLAGDLFTHLGNGLPAVTEDEILGPAIATEDLFKASALTPNTAPTVRKLAELKPHTIAVMHGSSYAGDGAAALNALADDYARRVEEATS